MSDLTPSPLTLSPLAVATFYLSSIILSSCWKDEATSGEHAPTEIHVHDIAIY
jgi:hypothetical protein